ncbi:MAG TPA: J domain-containing protein [Candidatus Acidoferrum sp.]|nr:J domain-containing protein [Candidatus Acidoferrum sp.]
MPGDELPIEKLKKAYRVLNVPESASALAIKSSYRKLIKRWHPDRPATLAATAAEAMTMTKLINDAYAIIENAPLRYYEERSAAEFVREIPRAREKRGMSSLSDAEVAQIEKRAEYGVRIVCGLLSGGFIGLIFAEDLLRNDLETFASALLCALVFGAGAVKLGDKVWREIFGIWWKWE